MRLILALFVLQLLASCTSYSRFPIDKEPKIPVDERLLGLWKMREDTNEHNYFVVEKEDKYHYSLTYMNRGGNNRGLEHFPAFLSEVNQDTFVNIAYWNEPDKGYFFIKLLYMQERGWGMKAALITDTTMKRLASSQAVREKIENNFTNRQFYSDTLHFRKLLELKSSK